MNGSRFMSLYRHWSWLGVPIILGALAALGFLIRGVITVARKAQLFRVPLAETQEVRFAEAGPVVLCIEGPRFSTRFARVGFELRSPAGEKVSSHPNLFRAHTSGVSKARMEMKTFQIPRPGIYILQMTSLGPPRERDGEHAVVFMRPHLFEVMARVLGIVLAGILFIASLVFFLMRLAGVGMTAR